MKRKGLIIANFGGPCCPSSTALFLSALLNDGDVVQSPLPTFLHRLLFSYIAKKRAKKIQKEYEKMGGKSPIFSYTESICSQLKSKLEKEKCSFESIWTFHRYLPSTHPYFLSNLCKEAKELDEILVFTFFPQFTYSTVGSIARFLRDYLPIEIAKKIVMIPSYPDHPLFIQSYRENIYSYMEEKGLSPNECAIVCSFHGLPQKFIDRGDPYARECLLSFNTLRKSMPGIDFQICYQSKFGPGQWLKPYTQDLCKKASQWCSRKHILMVPLAFTSDHIETLVEIEDEYLPILREQSFTAHRVNALNNSETWLRAMVDIIKNNPSQSLAAQISSYCPYSLFCRLRQSLGFKSCRRCRKEYD